MYNETICAISTANGTGAISIVRLSGFDAINIVNKIFKGKDLNKVKTHTINYGHIFDKNEMLDEVVVSVFKSPKTYTKEDIVEINCHGGQYVTSKILELVILNGARLAEPGEFTKRAFLNGRIDLTQAESVMDLIDAKTKNTLRMANFGLRGDIKNLISKFRRSILDCILKIEVNIDYPEYESEEQITTEFLLPTIKNNIIDINKIIEKSENSILIKEGITTAIIGKPNVGKSSILNALLREDKAIVTDIAGTTRDIIEGKINVGGVILNLIDTAGIRETSDIVEKIGVEKAKKIINSASLIIIVFDFSTELNENDNLILKLTENKNRIIVINKSDLPKKINLEILGEYLLLSAFSEKDINILENKIREVTNLKNIDNKEATYVTSIRAMTKLKLARDNLDNALVSVKNEMPIDIISIDLKAAWRALGEIIGEVSSEELLDEMFANFCLGK
ncbi:MAG: tRNA uridine-5-carboxymethylaminomethyl(34) synthesis GTPase MnmE [Bacilli bacterium]|jgi:tRNA modification GTPase|nr:tRNA uridine-5-carboxymethylaminomethyl(34) synthesis GTPase MnmE [Bacilli bacterium]MDD2682138.1 tRNA uridine-5-carboxymethylaminomethyl(34) synthesis GTPase MnmE [Bacilli bacterium]MDD3121756.1 tRNA uridine-5-carboxymethylaminomethyl(34) synthesis GTPase MnmE [Bacilli bacterium]MDD4063684.1 tRNA uridine-5-carboxymethylaminomethyl(34) synthesis GTPase MnmE [Bacilli bacterium]MDD4482548.1 tRNA uridine-5-carboxymethylaminomethyl(34) synthesis GTPase MnmE [Bacilli bacterium]